MLTNFLLLFVTSFHNTNHHSDHDYWLLDNQRDLNVHECFVPAVTGSWYFSVIELSPWVLRVFPSLWEKRDVRGETGRCEMPHAPLSQQQSQTEDAKLHFQSISLMFLCENRTFAAKVLHSVTFRKAIMGNELHNMSSWTYDHLYLHFKVYLLMDTFTGLFTKGSL